MTTIEILKRNNALTTENGYILLEPYDWGFTTYPLNDPSTAMRVTEDEYLGLMTGAYRINLDTRTVEEVVAEELETE